jgi:Fe2+ or Zn2+ uptake regulation protein
MKKCIGIIGAIFGHNYESRSSKVVEKSQRANSRLYIKTQITHHYDICTKCGDIIEKNSTTTTEKYKGLK